MDKILTHRMELPDGNGLHFFFNTTTSLLVVDLCDEAGKGGNEIVKRTLDIPGLLSHLRTSPKATGLHSIFDRVPIGQ